MPWITWRPPKKQDRREPELGQEADHRVVDGLQARGDHRLVEHARDAVAEALELAGSRAKDLTTRTPEMFSSASAVSSAMRCWTSWIAGRARRP